MEKFSYTRLLKYSKKLFNNRDVRKVLQDFFESEEIVGIRKIEKNGKLLTISLISENPIVLSLLNDKLIITKSSSNFVEKYEITALPTVSITTIERRTKGIIVNKVDKWFDYTSYSDKDKTVVDLYSKRYAVSNDTLDSNGFDDVNIIGLIHNLDFFSKLDNIADNKTSFESHFDCLIKEAFDLRWYKTTPYSTFTFLNGEDISYIYDTVNGIDKVSRIYDLYDGVINDRNINDIFSINLGLLRVDAFWFRKVKGIDSLENCIVGESLILPSRKYVDEASRLLSSEFYCSKDIDFSSRESIMDVIGHNPVLKKSDNK